MGAGPSRVLPGLYLGSEEELVTENYSWFIDNHVGHVVSLCDTAPPSFLPVKTLHIHALDDEQYDMLSHLPKIVEFIHNARVCGSSVFVHCKAGMSRSSTAVIAYVMCATKMSEGEAFNHVKRCREMVRPNNGFLRQLMVFGKNIAPLLTKLVDEKHGTSLRQRDLRCVELVQNGKNDDGCLCINGGKCGCQTRLIVPAVLKTEVMNSA
eukprot:Plantae.Rhodophyta-Purpureofilum_apyrenoidigerum.ctg2088.p1 GENE.Plantae.Rhodophyta-Purpureofilum_apyrenoidigerum.ctg2088~~Plantae.Rhodophyta-Purpureofilum_apyrenoidigerum.ctg2088.p1  ORF type:complete len:209 (+),score=31.52 Plantae.Rhodophyta-Purpureofilum_apyrenoidigerum.ctg2088:206-832(+)